MALNYTKLIRFDLLDDLDAGLAGSQDDLGVLFGYLAVVQEIANVDQFVRELPSYPQSTRSIIRDELVSAIGSTLAIEGITVRQDEIRETLQQVGVEEHVERRKREVLNSRRVYDYIRQEVDGQGDEFVYTIDHICTIHEYFTDGIDYPGNKPGGFRNCGATFGDPRNPSLCGDYASVYEAVKYLVEWLNKKTEGPWSQGVIAKALMAHYYLAEIHPFGDGNGRAARALEAMVLYANKMNHYCFWSLANFWSTHRAEYIAHLGSIRQSCDPRAFLLWGAKGYLEEVKRIKLLVLTKVKQLMFGDYVNYLLATNSERDAEKRINERIAGVLRLLAHLGRAPLSKFRSNIAYQAFYSNRSEPTAGRDLARMVSLGLVRITTTEDGEYIEPNYDIFNDLEYRG